jgi:hypothetical protein
MVVGSLESMYKLDFKPTKGAVVKSKVSERLDRNSLYLVDYSKVNNNLNTSS